MHLGATELFRGRRDSAGDAFRTLLLADPRYRPDDLVFPPEVSAAFHEVRLGVRAIAVVVPADIELRTVSDRVPIRIYASALHEIRVFVVGTDAVRVTDVLHDGAVGDSLEVLWSARDSVGRAHPAGRYSLRVVSRGPNGREEREVRIPLDVDRFTVDTLSAPPPLEPSQLRPEMTTPVRTTRPLLIGIVTAATAAFLPSVAGAESGGSSLRFGVAGLAGIAGVVGTMTSARPRAIPENIESNRVARAAWEQEVQRIERENAARRAAPRLRVRAGRATVTEPR